MLQKGCRTIEGKKHSLCPTFILYTDYNQYILYSTSSIDEFGINLSNHTVVQSYITVFTGFTLYLGKK